MGAMVDRLNAALEGRYRIERKLGEGGMATVFLAEDLKHHRKVAVKLLKPELAAVVGAERFLTEIETTANLQHPHILPLYDSGEADSFLFYVMPYVEGENLREKLDRERQLPVDDAVRIAKAVASGLDYAHRQGVVHRDIKPANILLQDGEPVIADFGIALAIQEAGGGRLTETGLSLGTPYYMSPEQATADRDPDARSDVYSLGCVLYEMLTGEPPFTGSSAQSVLGKILTADAVAPRQLRSTIPAHVEAAVLRSLAKVPADRFGSAAELARALDEGGAVAYPQAAGGAPGTAGEPNGARSPRAAWMPWTVAALALLTLVLVTTLGGGPDSGRDASAGTLRAVLELPDESFLDGTRIAISDDGSMVVARTLHEGRPVLMARPIDALEFGPVGGTTMADQQFLSPDGQTLAFRAAGEMRRVPVAGGPAITMDPEGAWAGGDWTEDGAVIYTRSYRSGLWRIAAGGGEPERLTDPMEDELGHWWPQVLPGGEHVLFTAFRTPISASRISVLSLETGERTEVFEGGVHARYVPTGHLLYARGDALYAIPFDLESLSVDGEGVVVIDDLAMEHSSGMGAYDIADNGTLVYIPASELNAPSELVWVDRAGRETPVFADSGLIMTPALAPDGRTVAFATMEPGEAEDVWTVDLVRGTRTRITSGGGADFGPIWSPDGETVVFTSEQPVFDLHQRRAGGGAPASPLVTSSYDKYVADFTPDGQLLYTVSDEASPEIWRVVPDGSGDPERFFAPTGGADQAAVSPNGRWLAYTSPESGRMQVYLSPYDDPSGARRQVSIEGGVGPRWSRDGREVVYQNGGSMLAVSVDPESGDLGRPEQLFDGPYLDPVINYTRNYDVTPDGARFLMVKRSREHAPRRVVVVTGFFDELRALTGDAND